MAWRPKFDTIYQGEWPYRGDEGVGLRLRLDIDPMKYPGSFPDLLIVYGCPEGKAGEITERLITHGVRHVTVAHNIDFDTLAIEMAVHGVRMEIIPPQQGWRKVV